MSKFKLVATTTIDGKPVWLVEDDEMYYAVTDKPNPHMDTGGIYASPCRQSAARWSMKWDIDIGNKVLPMSIVNRIHAAKENEAFKIIVENQKRIWKRKTLYPDKELRRNENGG